MFRYLAGLPTRHPKLPPVHSLRAPHPCRSRLDPCLSPLSHVTVLMAMLHDVHPGHGLLLLLIVLSSIPISLLFFVLSLAQICQFFFLFASGPYLSLQLLPIWCHQIALPSQCFPPWSWTINTTQEEERRVDEEKIPLTAEDGGEGSWRS